MIEKVWCIICDGYCKHPEGVHTPDDRRERAQKYRFLKFKRPMSDAKAREACGTLGGRGMHERRGEPLCERCKEARRQYAKKRYYEQKERANA